MIHKDVLTWFIPTDFATLLHVRIKVAGKVCAEAVHILYKGVFMTIRMSLICLVIISSSCLGQSKVQHGMRSIIAIWSC